MSVFYQAVLDRRISKDECRSRPKCVGGQAYPDVTVISVTARALRAIKREEAEYRNRSVELPRTKSYRRQLAADLAAAARRRHEAVTQQ